MSERISSLDAEYTPGMLSVFPEAIDDHDILYWGKNNAETKLKQSLSFNAKYIVVEDASVLPDTGLVRVGERPSSPELIYYGEKTNYILKQLKRGFAGSIQSQWPVGSPVCCGVMAEAHNATKDALLNIEAKVGTSVNPDSNSVNGWVTQLEQKYLTPKATFRAFPKSGPPPLNVRFQNFSEGDIVRYFWEFGDGSRSVEKNPNHTYLTEGLYTVKLSIITSTGGQGAVSKSNYITVSEEEAIPFFYIVQVNPSIPAYSVETANHLVQTGENPLAEPAEFLFVDQTDGDIAQRYWVFGDGEVETVADPNQHTTTHTYQSSNEYEPILMILFSNDTLRRVFLQNKLVVL